MPVYAPPDTLSALGPGLKHCTSRSLFQDRFADPQAKDADRKNWFNALCQRKAEPIIRADWLPEGSVKLHARLMSRLMVNLAGGVMENANVLLDRYGLPIIPGSAVKGCARRMALQALHDWVAAGSARPADDDVCAPCCEGFETPAAMLAAIARVFGWVAPDWREQSDYAWASHGKAEILAAARALLPAPDSFSGTIAFLTASPNRDPDIELDVVTPHHTEYYKRTPGYENAPDTEDPIPVFFPAVAPQKDGQYFTFPLIPLGRAADGYLQAAKTWLAHGLEIFGIGAKTNAGYGWFDASDALNIAIAEAGRRHTLANELAAAYWDFDNWDTEKKDAAVLELSDRLEDCRIWYSADPQTFEPIRLYGESQGLSLI